MILRKPTELEIPSAKPFENDCFQREGIAENLTRLIQSTQQPFVLSVEAPWGFGKTTFVRMWQAHLEAQGHVCMSFNAWENDFVEDPLVAFLGEMQKAVDSHINKLTEDTAVKKAWGEVKRIGGGVLRKALPYAVQQATLGVLSAEVIKLVMDDSQTREKLAEAASKLAEERLAKYEAEKEGISGFRKNLGELTKALVTKEGAKAPIIFFVDELDRCRPDFAVALLERIKHLFNVNQVVFVLSIDRGQLRESVKALYGSGMDADGYLRRFIDLAFSLPEPDVDNKTFAEHLCRRTSLEEVFAQRRSGGNEAQALIESFAIYAKRFRLSLRAQEQAFTELNIAIRTIPSEANMVTPALAFLVALRASRRGIFEDLRQKRIPISEISDVFKSDQRSWYCDLVEPTLVMGLLPESDQKTWWESVEQAAKEGEGNSQTKARLLMDACRGLRANYHIGFPAIAVGRIELTARFK